MGDRLGIGERADRARRRRVALLVGGLGLSGALVGFAVGLFERGGDAGPLTGTIPLWLAVLGSVVMAVSLSWGSWRFFAAVDEVERRDNHLAGSIAIYFYTILYGCWLLFWRAGAAPEPQHMILFAATWIAAGAVYLWLKLRR